MIKIAAKASRSQASVS